MRHMKIEVLIDDGNKIKKESFFILDPDKKKSKSIPIVRRRRDAYC